MSALLYCCESWLGADLKPVTKLYNWAIKQLLGVRKSTPNDVCYAEAGYPSLPDLLRLRQQSFFKKMESERRGQPDDPLMYTINVVMRANTVTSTKIRDFLSTEMPTKQDLMRKYTTASQFLWVPDMQHSVPLIQHLQCTVCIRSATR